MNITQAAAQRQTLPVSISPSTLAHAVHEIAQFARRILLDEAMDVGVESGEGAIEFARELEIVDDRLIETHLPRIRHRHPWPRRGEFGGRIALFCGLRAPEWSVISTLARFDAAPPLG